MRPFDELTARGQLRRLRLLARTAVDNYPAIPDDARMSLVLESFNTVFRVSAPHGPRCALRVGPSKRIHADSTEVVETQWMRTLRAERAVPAPDVFDARDGSPVVRQSHPGVPNDRICMLFSWIPGMMLRQAMTTTRARQMGVLAAIWSDQPHSPHLLHGDFTASNVIVSKGLLVPIDFQDLVWGFDIQDLVISLASLARFHEGEALREEFRAGYEAIRSWPDLDSDMQAALTAARRLHQLNLGLNLRKPGLDDFVARGCQLVGEWMSSK